MFLLFFRKNSIKFYETIYVYMKKKIMESGIKQRIIHYDNITINEQLRSLMK